MGSYISSDEAADPMSMGSYISTMEAADPISISAWKSSPVRFFGFFGQDRDRDQSIKTHTSRKTGPRPQKTAKSVFAVFLRSLDRSKPVFVLKTVATNLYI